MPTMSLPVAPAALVSCGFLALTMKIPTPVRMFFKSVLQHLYDKITDDAAEWVAKIFWYMLSLLIWYAMGHINLLL
jgi:hypothetical protein